MSSTSVPSLEAPDPVTYTQNLGKSVQLINKILSIQSQSIHHLSNTYQFSPWAISQLQNSLRIMNDALLCNNKLIITGIGKSFKIASKIVATLNSLSLHSTILHPLDALHGDLGIVRDGDVLVMISASGSSSELIHLLSHLELTKIKILLLTCSPDSILSNHEKISSLIYLELPNHFKEENVYGLNAPTISTTLLLTLMDGVSILLSELHIADITLRRKLFGERHPGGAIGQSYSSSSEEATLVDFSINNFEISQEYKEDKEEPIDLTMSDLIKDKNQILFNIQEFPDTKEELFELLITNDILIWKNSKAALSSDVIDLIKHSDFNDFQEWKWRIIELFKPILL